MIFLDFTAALLDQSQNMHVRSFIAIYHCMAIYLRSVSCYGPNNYLSVSLSQQ